MRESGVKAEALHKMRGERIAKGIDHVRDHFPMRTMLDNLEALHENICNQVLS